MLKALYEWAEEHPDKCYPDGFYPRTVSWIAMLGADGSFLGFRRPDNAEKRPVMPYVFGITVQAEPNVLMEKAEAALLLGKPSSKSREKHEKFIGLFEDGSGYSPVLGLVSDILKDDDTMDDIRTAALTAGVKPGDTVAFSVDGILLHDDPVVRTWWSDRTALRVAGMSGAMMPDIVTGGMCVPVKTVEKKLSIKAAGGGQSSGSALISFNGSSFESYGLEQALNASMSYHTANHIMDALNWLGEHGIRFGTMKVLHWYRNSGTRQESDVPDVLAELFGGETDANVGITDDIAAEKTAGADALVQSVFKGGMLPMTGGDEFHMILLKPNVGRTAVRYYGTGPYEGLYVELSRWFDDMRLVSRDGRGRTKNQALGSIIVSVSPEKNAKDWDKRFAPVHALLEPSLMCAVGRGVMPDGIVVPALGRIRSMMVGKDGMDARPFQALKLWLNRGSGSRNGGTKMKEGLDPKRNSPGYQCGRLLAVYDGLRKLAMRDDGLLGTYYAACSTRPAFVIGRLQQLANYYSAKVCSGRHREMYRAMLSDVYSMLSDGVPGALDTAGQAEFAVGYWHQAAEIQRLYFEMKNGSKTAENNEED